MTAEQAKNVKQLCKNAPISSIIRLMDFYRDDDIKAMAEYYGVSPNKDSVIAYLMM